MFFLSAVNLPRTRFYNTIQHGSSVAQADVTSANIVGYQNIKVEPGWSFFTVTFENIKDATKFNLSDIKFVKADGTDWLRTGATLKSCNGSLNIQKVDAEGTYGTKYKYYGKNASDTFGPGWYEGARENDGSNLVTGDSVTLNKGEGLVVYLDTTKTEGGLLVVSGNVQLVPFNGFVAPGWAFGGNCTPTTINLADIKCTKADGTDWLRTGATLKSCNGSLNIQKVDAEGTYGTKYKYYGKNASDTFGPGWYEGARENDGSNLITGDAVTFAPGEGWVMYLDTTKTEGAKLVIPAPIKESK